MKETMTQLNLPGVPRAKQGREVPERWQWTEAAVWTESMLATLERGVRGGKWFSLIDKVWKVETLQGASKKVIANDGSAGVDRESTEKFAEAQASKVAELSEQLRTGTYRVQAVKRVWIDKLGSREKRPLGVPAVRDRVVQTGLRAVIEPIFEKEFAEHSYGFRPGRGAQQALDRVETLLKQGKVWVVDADIKGYFDNIPQEKLMELVEEKIADGRVLELLRDMLHAGVMETCKGWQPTEKGTPQGAVISPLLANIYLNPLDHQMVKNQHEMTRYADDFVIMCSSKQEAEAVMEKLRRWIEEAGLTLHPEKTRIVNAQEGEFEFLGYRFERGRKWPRKKSLERLKDTIRKHTPRNSGESMERISQTINPVLKGWGRYFYRCYPTTFSSLDGYIRGRMRSILRRRIHLRGRGRGADHQRWPNAYFTEQGLLFLSNLCQVSQSP